MHHYHLSTAVYVYATAHQHFARLKAWAPVMIVVDNLNSVLLNYLIERLHGQHLPGFLHGIILFFTSDLLELIDLIIELVRLIGYLDTDLFLVLVLLRLHVWHAELLFVEGVIDTPGVEILLSGGLYEGLPSTCAHRLT